jgi:hypothetical protein
MITEAELKAYEEEIRREVCGRCVDRPAGGPPCYPLGKVCGIELHLAELVESVCSVHSPLLEPYLEKNRLTICSCCAYHQNADACPCPMDYLAELSVEAIEQVKDK